MWETRSGGEYGETGRDGGTYFSETATVVGVLLLLRRRFLAETGVGSFPLLVLALFGEVNLVL